jgi:hypothetical protein
MMYYKAGNYETAANLFNKANNLAPASKEVVMNQGLIDMMNGEYKDAAAAFGNGNIANVGSLCCGGQSGKIGQNHDDSQSQGKCLFHCLFHCAFISSFFSGQSKALKVGCGRSNAPPQPPDKAGHSR